MTLRTVEIIMDGVLGALTRKNILVHTKEKSPLALIFFNDVHARFGITIESFDAVMPTEMVMKQNYAIMFTTHYSFYCGFDSVLLHKTDQKLQSPK